MARYLLYTVAYFAFLTQGLPQQSTTIDPNDPNSADPASLPDQDFTLPLDRTPEPFVNGIPQLPDVCDPSQLTEDCFNALGNDESGAYVYFEKDHGCNDDQQNKIKLGFWDAQDLLKYAARWSSGRSSRDIISADYWIGPDWRSYTSRLQGNLGRASDFINNEDNKKNYITITCKDPKNYCTRKSLEGGKVIGGYAWNVNWLFWTYGHINMCDPYYSLTDITGKIDELNGYRKDGNIDRLQDMRYYQTYGQFLAHEMMHLKSTYDPEPGIVDAYLWGGTGKFQNDVRAYGAKRVHQLAQGDASGSDKESGGIVSTINADSYAMLINSMFWWDATQFFPGVPGKKEGSGPPGIGPPHVIMPSISLGNVTDLSASSIDDQFDQAMASYLIGDDAEKEPQSDDTFTVSPTQDINACHGVSGDYWVMTRDIAVDNVNDFCVDQTDRTKQYNVGSVNELELSIRKLDDDSKGPKDAPDCVARFVNAVIDGCDGGDPLNNPHNYKFGSTLTTADGWEYKMTPLSKQVNEINCDVSYKFFFDNFEIRGKNLPDALFGAEGQGLHDQLAGCGALTNWNFERTPDDCCFQWYASGQLPIGTKNCVGDALQSAGGSSDGNCHGAGKRDLYPTTTDGSSSYGDGGNYGSRRVSRVKRDSISSWPGYGDGGKHVFRNSTQSYDS